MFLAIGKETSVVCEPQGTASQNSPGLFWAGTTVTLARWLMGLVFAQFVLKFVTRIMRFLTPSTDPSSVTVEPRRMAAAW